MHTKCSVHLASIILFLVTPVFAEDAVRIRIVDVGAGHCAVVTMPGDHYMIYDAGFYNGIGRKHTIQTIQQLIPEGSEVDLLVLSNSEADHLGVVDEICAQYKIKRILRSGYE